MYKDLNYEAKKVIEREIFAPLECERQNRLVKGVILLLLTHYSHVACKLHDLLHKTDWPVQHNRFTLGV